VEYAILPQLVDRLEAAAPLARLAVRPMDFGAVGRQLEAAEVDLGILGAGFAPPNVRSRPLYLERFVCVVRRDHRRVRDRLTLDDFCALDHLLVSPSGGSFTAATDDVLAAIGRQRRVRLLVPHFLLVPEILVHSDMIAMLPERLARGYSDRFRVFELPFEMPPFTIAEVWHERTHRDPALAAPPVHCRPDERGRGRCGARSAATAAGSRVAGGARDEAGDCPPRLNAGATRGPSGPLAFPALHLSSWPGARPPARRPVRFAVPAATACAGSSARSAGGAPATPPLGP
jgi:hypothetical protein